jgi:hypothetical protein
VLYKLDRPPEVTCPLRGPLCDPVDRGLADVWTRLRLQGVLSRDAVRLKPHSIARRAAA